MLVSIRSYCKFKFLIKKALKSSKYFLFFLQDSHWYFIAYLTQILCHIQLGFDYGISSGIFMSMVSALLNQYDILYCSLKNIRYTGMIQSGECKTELIQLQKKIDFKKYEVNEYFNALEFFENLEDIDSKAKNLYRKIVVRNKYNYLTEYDEEISAAISDCIKHHQVILQFCKKLEEFYHPFILLKILQITFLICFLAYLASSPLDSLMKLINILEYLALTSSELLIFCYYGEVVERHSGRIGDALMKSEWYLSSGSTRKKMIVMMANSQPVRFTAGKFYFINFVKFFQVFKASFSYFTLLKNIK